MGADTSMKGIINTKCLGLLLLLFTGITSCKEICCAPEPPVFQAIILTEENVDYLSLIDTSSIEIYYFKDNNMINLTFDFGMEDNKTVLYSSGISFRSARDNVKTFYIEADGDVDTLFFDMADFKHDYKYKSVSFNGKEGEQKLSNDRPPVYYLTKK